MTLKTLIPTAFLCIACGGSQITPASRNEQTTEVPQVTSAADSEPIEAPSVESRRTGTLSKAVIQETIRKSNNRVRYCYEKELQKAPDLEGKITVRFVISPTGAVETADVMQTTLNNATVEECVLKVTREMQFPKPTNNGFVLVKHPYVLRSNTILGQLGAIDTDAGVGGVGGLGLTGSGRGGGGIGVGTIGQGSGTRYGYGRARPIRQGSTMRLGKPTLIGPMDKEVIRRVMRRNQNRMRYCYEKELVKTPSLAGRVTIKFTIGSDGSVTAASIRSSTLGSVKVEECLVNQTKRFMFPKPKGGGLVIVSYPYVFAPGTPSSSGSGGGVGMRSSGPGGGGSSSGSIGSLGSSQGGNPTVRGSLDKEVIRRVIQRQINQIRYCYEKELAKEPSLAGRVTVKFIIAPKGHVQTVMVQSSTLGNTKVEQCVARETKRLKFPEPKGGGVVIVNYPYNFSTPTTVRN